MTERRPLRDDVRGRPCRDTRGICKAGWLRKGMVLVGDGNDLPETVTKVWRGSNRVETDHAPGGRYLDLWADHEVVYRDGKPLVLADGRAYAPPTTAVHHLRRILNAYERTDGYDVSNEMHQFLREAGTFLRKSASG